MAGICTSPYPSPYPIEKVGDSPYPVNAGIPRQNEDGFGQYPRGRVYLPSLNSSGLECEVYLVHFKGINGESE